MSQNNDQNLTLFYGGKKVVVPKNSNNEEGCPFLSKYKTKAEGCPLFGENNKALSEKAQKCPYIATDKSKGKGCSVLVAGNGCPFLQKDQESCPYLQKSCPFFAKNEQQKEEAKKASAAAASKTCPYSGKTAAEVQDKADKAKGCPMLVEGSGCPMFKTGSGCPVLNKNMNNCPYLFEKCPFFLKGELKSGEKVRMVKALMH